MSNRDNSEHYVRWTAQPNGNITQLIGVQYKRLDAIHINQHTEQSVSTRVCTRNRDMQIEAERLRAQARLRKQEVQNELSSRLNAYYNDRIRAKSSRATTLIEIKRLEPEMERLRAERDRLLCGISNLQPMGFNRFPSSFISLNVDNMLLVREFLAIPSRQPSISAREPNWRERWADNPDVLYGIANNIWIVAQVFSLNLLGRNHTHPYRDQRVFSNIDGTPNYRGGPDALVNTIALAFGVGAAGTVGRSAIAAAPAVYNAGKQAVGQAITRYAPTAIGRGAAHYSRVGYTYSYLQGGVGLVGKWGTYGIYGGFGLGVIEGVVRGLTDAPTTLPHLFQFLPYQIGSVAGNTATDVIRNEVTRNRNRNAEERPKY